MKDDPDDLERRRMRQRIVELRNRLHEITGGEMEFGAGDPNRPLSEEEELAFLERIYAVESAPHGTWLDRLGKDGYAMPNPASLTDEELGLEVWQVIQRLSELGAYLCYTDHLSDRQLYERLYHDVLREETMILPAEPNSAYHFDLVGSGSDEDIEAHLRYYADETYRDLWRSRFPEDPMPPHDDPSYQRDHLLPQPVYEPPPLHRYLDRLIRADWGSEDCPMKLSPDLTEADLVDSLFFADCRVMLETLSGTGPVKATATLGNLPQRFVAAVFKAMTWSPEEQCTYEKIVKSRREEEITRVFAARLACQQAGLLRKYRGMFQMTRRGNQLLDSNRAGELYQRLFTALLRKVNLACLDGCPELPEIQATAAISLWRLSVVAEDWIDLETLQAQTQLPDILDALDAEDSLPYRTPGHILDTRFWRHIEALGLLTADRDGINRKDPIRYRTTPLYSRFLSFEAPPTD